MIDLKQSAEMALEALDSCEENSWSVSFDGVLVEQALDALRQALAQSDCEWVNLTDNEMESIWNITPPEYQDRFAFARAVEATLKEKNT